MLYEVITNKLVDGPGAHDIRPLVFLRELHGPHDLLAALTGQPARKRVVEMRIGAFAFNGAVNRHPARRVGDVAWLDKDENDIIDTRDRVYMGNIYPKWTGGLSNTLSYKGLSLYLRMDYSTGHTIYNYVRANMNGQFVRNNFV